MPSVSRLRRRVSFAQVIEGNLDRPDRRHIDVVHLTSDATALTVLVDESEADHVVGVFSRFYQPSATHAPGRLAS